MTSEALRILLADHEPSSRQALFRELERAGHTVQIADDGEDVLLLCDLDPPDVLIMDVDLPDIDGFEVCECVRRQARGADLTIIVIAQPTNRMTRTYLGQMVKYVDGDYFFAKPCDTKVLIELLDDLSTCPEGPTEARSPGFPTHVTWPSSRPRACGVRA